MKYIIKPLVALIVAGSAFFFGFYFGQEKVKTKIPDFQDNLES